MSEKWKPIETAPKNKGAILVRGEGILNAPRIVVWYVERKSTAEGFWVIRKEGWYDSYAEELFTSEATHWAKCSTREKLKKHYIGRIWDLTKKEDK